MTDASSRETASDHARLVPELLVTNIAESLRFWCDVCGFAVLFERREEGFAYLHREGSEIMLEERGCGRNWITAAVEPPFGRGVNFQIGVSDILPILSALEQAGWPLFMAPERKWYRTGMVETGVDQFLVQDPDGYLIRFSARAGKRAIGRREA